MKILQLATFVSLAVIVLSACQPRSKLPPPPVVVVSKPKPPEIIEVPAILTPPAVVVVKRPPVIHYPKGVERPRLSAYELRVISDKIYLNEASSNPDKLMIWAKGENFASVGIGHFIWYPAGEPKRFDETFPAMIDYFVKNKVVVPSWLATARRTGAPWKNKATFEHAKNDKEFRQLKILLLNTKELQTQFFFDRIHESIPQIVKLAPPQDRKRIIANYNALAHTKGGWYPLIDYINFKGKGTKSSERYHNKGWGLLQALQEMQPVEAGAQALDEFSRATQAVLERRVRNSPPANNENRWLPGWKNRTSTYRRSLL
ncbi:MAG: hypothetical protein KAH00_05095 [Cocleimonas sp.]|nr:hypothetical protein [Cocleimonas sp.]